MGTIDLDYSPDHRFLGVLAPDRLLVLATQTGARFDELSFGVNFTATSFAFNSDSSMLAVGSKQGETQLFNIVSNKFVPMDKVLNDQPTSTVESLCFTSDNVNVIVVATNQVIAWSWNSDSNLTTSFSGEYVKTVSCSPNNPKLFVAGGGSIT